MIQNVNADDRIAQGAGGERRTSEGQPRTGVPGPAGDAIARCAAAMLLAAWWTPLAIAEGPDQSALQILPARIELFGEGAEHRVLLQHADGETIRQQIPHEQIAWSVADPEIARVKQGRIVALRDGMTRLQAVAHGMSASVDVEVHRATQPVQPDFARHVLPALTKAGCNSGACHGALAGKGGFKLSLRGYDPAGDFRSITQTDRGRRIERAAPRESLLLAKPSMRVAHKGGLRLPEASDDYRVISEWVLGGMVPPGEQDPTLVDIVVAPASVRLGKDDQQPLLVQARYADGRVEDVTRWAKFSSADESIAQVDEEGHVTVTDWGECAIVVWFSSRIKLAQVSSPYPNQLTEEVFRDAPKRNFVDRLVEAKLVSLNLAPAPRSSDSEFVRRVYLSVIGTLPTEAEVRDFLADTAVDKRDRLIDALLARDEFVDYWTFRWSDLLLVNGRRLRPDAVKAYYQWIRERVANNTPWDEFARQVVTASGSTIENGAANFYSLHQDPESMTENVCQAFMSLSIGCAKCHNHPLEKWTNDQYYAMASHFARVRGKGWGGDARSGDGIRTVFAASQGELIQPLRGKPQPPTPLDGQPLDPDLPEDRRQYLADWLTSPDNPYFARAVVNRVWAALMGIGIVEPVDDLRVSNPASNQPLLDALAADLIANDYDLTKLMRTILQSETFQRSSTPTPGNQRDRRFFSRYFPHRLPAEVLLDAISQVTEVPSQFDQIGYDGNDFVKTTEYPTGTRAIELADSAVVSDFLSTFGRNERDITCECERSNTPSLVQVLHISNGTTINDRLDDEKSCVNRVLASDRDWTDVVEDVYLRALSRYPTDAESQQLVQLLQETPDAQRREAIEDLFWGVLSSREFLFNH